MAYPLSLSGLNTRAEITDTVICACLGLDSNDKGVIRAADPDVSMSTSNTVMKGMEKIKHCFDSVSPMDTQHLSSSIRIDVKEGADTARLTASALGQHFRAGEGREPNTKYRLAGSIYDIQVVK